MSHTTTSTVTADAPVVTLKGNVSSSLPEKLDDRFDKHSRLSREQCGHIRHIHNLASKLDGEWGLMGAQEVGQEWDTAFRYQISAMTYAITATHYHRLPAMRSMLKGLIWKLIQKMLRKEVWGYWYLTSQSGIFLDPDLKEMRKPWADPVCKENIMVWTLSFIFRVSSAFPIADTKLQYSGHLLHMVSLYTMLFADDAFDKDDSIVFNWNPLFWGFGPERFSYTRLTLQKTILAEMEQSGWMGVCCEPNLVFIICNQFPVLSI